MSKLSTFEKWIRTALSEPLPGQSAQKLMMPSLHSKSRFDLNTGKTARPGAVMILFYQQKNELKFPLILRPDYDGVHGNQVSFPGGKKDPEDGSLIQTALRETEEEIGVAQGAIQVIGFLTELYVVASNFNVLPVVGFTSKPPEFTPDPHEVELIMQVKVSDLMNEQLRKEKKMKIMHGISINAPYFELEQQVVWGATSMILSELFVLLKRFKGSF